MEAENNVTGNEQYKMEAENNVTGNEQYRTDLGKCTHQCDEKQGNNSNKHFRQTLPSSGVRREMNNKKELVDFFLLRMNTYKNKNEYVMNSFLAFSNTVTSREYQDRTRQCLVFWSESPKSSGGMLGRSRCIKSKIQEIPTAEIGKTVVPNMSARHLRTLSQHHRENRIK